MFLRHRFRSWLRCVTFLTTTYIFTHLIQTADLGSTTLKPNNNSSSTAARSSPAEHKYIYVNVQQRRRLRCRRWLWLCREQKLYANIRHVRRGTATITAAAAAAATIKPHNVLCLRTCHRRRASLALLLLIRTRRRGRGGGVWR